ncbi:hypothetical protein HQ571_05150 [Candidatus Kuenenbacteria bacterium]|nr:hypothetical protein [Candidatus Kuenenbacteria bacterium]
MAKKIKFNLTGVLAIVIVSIFVFLLIFAVYIYEDLKSVEQGVFNLHEQIKVNSKTLANTTKETKDENNTDFSATTKNWKIHQNNNFNFQFKNPKQWGSFLLELVSFADSEKDEKFFTGKFVKEKQISTPQLIVASYHVSKNEKLYSSEEVENVLEESDLGECSVKLFNELEKLDIGQVRNCFIKENILKQKYISYRYYLPADAENPETNNLTIVFPREDFFIQINPTDESNKDLEYFIQSLVFLD